LDVLVLENKIKSGCVENGFAGGFTGNHEGKRVGLKFEDDVRTRIGANREGRGGFGAPSERSWGPW
jgi:hypothetical protein